MSAPPEPLLRATFRAVGVLHLALGAWMLAAPRSFFTSLGSFGAYSPHYERDAATFYLAFAAGAWLAATRPTWRVPVLAMIAVQYAVHTVNHLADVSRSHNGWSGPFDAASLGASALAFAALLWVLAHREAPR